MSNLSTNLSGLYMSHNFPKLKISGTAAFLFKLYGFTPAGSPDIILEQMYTPDENGVSEIDVRDVIHEYLIFTMPTAEASIEQKGIVQKFKVNVDGKDSPTFYVLRGGVDNQTLDAADFIRNNFLTWQPTMKGVTYHTPEYLTYCSNGHNNRMMLKAYMEDGTTQEVELKTFTAGIHCYTVDVSYARVAGLCGNRMPKYYDVWTENKVDSTITQLSYVQRYYAESMKTNNEEWIMFENSLGGIDTFRAYGDNSLAHENDHMVADMDGGNIEYRVDVNRIHKKDTGLLNKYDSRWLLDFFPSAAKYIYTGNYLRPIVITKSDVKGNANAGPISYSFSYKFANDWPLLNLTRTPVDNLPLNIKVPDMGSFTVPPRLAEFPRIPLVEGVLFPVQEVNADHWSAVPANSIADYVVKRIKEGGGYVGGGDIPTELLGRFLRKDQDDKTEYSLEIGKMISNLLESSKFSMGDLGSGFQLSTNRNGHSRLELDELFVRKVAYFVELVIKRLRHVGGEIILSPASMQCIKVEEHEEFWRCFFQQVKDGVTIYNEFIEGDQARLQTFNVKEGVNQNARSAYYWGLVVGVGEDYIDLSKSVVDDGSSYPCAGDDIVQLGCRRGEPEYRYRQSCIVLSTVGPDAPSIKQYHNITRFSLLNKEVTVLSPSGNKLTASVSTTEGSNLDELVNDVKADVEAVRGQVDQMYIMWFDTYVPTLNNAPANEWNEQQRAEHVEDMFYNRESGHAYRFTLLDNGTYDWVLITDVDTTRAMEIASKAQDTADGKRRTFVNTPTDADEYDVGDLWVNAHCTIGEIEYENDCLRCETPKKAGEPFSVTHWKPVGSATSAELKVMEDRITSKVTDVNDGLASQITQTAGKISGEVADVKKDLQSSITQNANDIALKVNASGVINAINVSTEGISISGSKVNISGNTTFSSLSKKVDGLPTSSSVSTSISNALKGYATTGDVSGVETALNEKYKGLSESYNSLTNKYNSIPGWSLKSSIKAALEGETIISGGFISTSMIDVGTILGKNAIFSGSLSAAKGTFSGSLIAANGTFSGSLSAATGTFSGELKAAKANLKGLGYGTMGVIRVDGDTIKYCDHNGTLGGATYSKTQGDNPVYNIPLAQSGKYFNIVAINGGGQTYIFNNDNPFSNSYASTTCFVVNTNDYNSIYIYCNGVKREISGGAAVVLVLLPPSWFSPSASNLAGGGTIIAGWSDNTWH